MNEVQTEMKDMNWVPRLTDVYSQKPAAHAISSLRRRIRYQLYFNGKKKRWKNSTIINLISQGGKEGKPQGHQRQTESSCLGRDKNHWSKDNFGNHILWNFLGRSENKSIEIEIAYGLQRRWQAVWVDLSSFFFLNRAGWIDNWAIENV